MKTTVEVHVAVEQVSSVTRLGELSKLTAKLGLDAVIGQDAKFDDAVRLDLSTREPQWWQNALAALTVVVAVSEDLSPDQVIARLTREIEKLQLPMDSKPSDFIGIGEGPSQT